MYAGRMSASYPNYNIPIVSVIGGAGCEGPGPHVEGEHAAPVAGAVVTPRLSAGPGMEDRVLRGRADRGHGEAGLLRPQGPGQRQAEAPGKQGE